MCLSNPQVPAKGVRNSTIIGYRVARVSIDHYGQPVYSPVHQNPDSDFLPAGQFNKAKGKKSNAGFHVFKSLADAKAYRRDKWGSKNLVVLKVRCTDIWRTGSHSVSFYRKGEAFTCGKMSIIGRVFPTKAKLKWRPYNGTIFAVAVSPTKPKASYKLMPWVVEETTTVKGEKYAIVSSAKGKRVKLVLHKRLWTLG